MDEILDQLGDLSLSGGQSKSTGGAPPNLDNLAVELKVTLLKSMPDIPSLRSLVQSSPSYHDVFVARRHEILSSVTGLADIQPKVLIDALAVKDATVIIVPTEEHIRNYQNSRLTMVPAFRYADAPDLNPLHQIICDLTRHFTSNWLSKHPVTGEQLHGSEKLSKVETGRIHRAFYRFELFSKFLGQIFGLERIASTLYFEIFEAYEVEEMACLYISMWEIYASFLNQFQVELLPKDVSPKGNWFHQNINHFITCGLTFFHQVLQAPTSAETLELLRANLHVSMFTIAEALSVKSPHVLQHTDKFMDHNGAKLFFTHDDESHPNAAWVWSTGGVYEFENFQAEKETMRSWGYVFWDKKRLDEWGVLEFDPQRFVSVAMTPEMMMKHWKYSHYDFL